MSEQQKSYSFGRYLQSIRLEKGISLEAVSWETRIRVGTLLLIEKEDKKKLPADVFVKGFLRAFAKAIGADEEEAVRRYISDQKDAGAESQFEADLQQSATRFWRRLIFAFVILGGIIFLSIRFIPFDADQSEHIQKSVNRIDTATNPKEVETSEPDVSEKATFPDEGDEGNTMTLPAGADGNEPAVLEKDKGKTIGTDQTVDDTDGAMEVSPESEVRVPAEDKYLLKIITVENTWLKVIIDTQKSKQYSLSPGDRLVLEAVSGYNLLIGNAAGLEMELNGKPLKVAGKRGQVVNVEIP